MVNVIEVLKLETGNSVLMIDAKDKSNVKGRIKTSAGVFSPSQYEVVEGTACFTDAPLCGVFLKTTKDCTGIKEIIPA